jgi:hypothetical protein
LAQETLHPDVLTPLGCINDFLWLLVGGALILRAAEDGLKARFTFLIVKVNPTECQIQLRWIEYAMHVKQIFVAARISAFVAWIRV